jgi:hypothetical protein
MSTKATIAYGPTFHLYHEALDEDFVYLEIEGTQFEASYNRVMVPMRFTFGKLFADTQASI